MNKVKIIVVCVLIIMFLGTAVFFGATPKGVEIWNTYTHSLQKADDNTNYAAKKKVEDTCRSMISSYNSDKLTYEQYKDSDNKEKQSWAEQAKMRANKTASSYNIYILENSYVWENNIPDDIENQLSYIE